MAEHDAANEKRRASYQQILQDHHLLHQLFGALEASSGSASLAGGRLSELHDLLQVHFRREEADDGLHAIVGDAAPHLLDEIDRLAREHRAVLAAINDLHTRLEESSAEARAGITNEVADLLRRLREHEARESRMLNDSLTRDLGGGD